MQAPLIARSRFVRTALLGGLLIATAPVWSSTAPDVETACLDCHRPQQDRGAVPVIEGQHADYLRAQLQRFQQRHREGFPMNALSAGLDETSLSAMADALAARPWRAASSAPQPHAEAGREQLDAFDCASCHGSDFRGGGSIPRIAGQQAAYLQRQIAAFGEAERHHPPVGGGARMYGITPDAAEAIAAALAELD
jgi:cytochrome c553